MTSMPVRSADPAPAVIAEPLPLPAHGWGLAQAEAAWRAALPSLPADVLAALAVDHDVVRVSALTTVVLRVGPWAVKVYPPGTDLAHVASVAAGLAGSATAHLPVTDPVQTEHGVVTVSRWLTPTSAPGWADVGRVLARFHAEHAAAPLPVWQPLTRIASQVSGLPDVDAAVLLGARDRLVAAAAETWSELGWGAVHGDVSLENAMADESGARLIDLDWSVTGPRELDLAPVARRFRAGEIDRSTYADFCRAYGHDVSGWAGLELLDRIAELGGVAFRIWDCRHHGRDLDWLPAALDRWRRPV
ncbi:hypothetical protein SAMN04487968_10868 [Nocardioides terrae]|uniref:Phosphotransferase enzyme family protein n=1 Tax=Nocardioides terrae TaxID=574651 RepID=A0A1I1KAU1_9ACTN|nr:hypothetical protein [Nocardioides terrae]SFC58019.1 hypothetical protein SAMN04487968_10868 [Nocardioides terrae]